MLVTTLAKLDGPSENSGQVMPPRQSRMTVVEERLMSVQQMVLGLHL